MPRKSNQAPQAPARMPQVLSAGEVQALKEEKNELEGTLKQVGSEEFGKGTPAEQIDKGVINQQIRRIDAALHAGAPQKLAGSQKDKLAQEARQLEAAIQKGMPNQNEMDNPRKNPGAIRKNQLWEKNNRGNIERWKQIQRTLEHGDPTASNVERLRSR